MRSPPGASRDGRPRRDHATVEVQTRNTFVRCRCWSESRRAGQFGDTIAGQERPTLAEAGEFGLIAELTAWLPSNPRTLVGIGDDAAVLATPDGRVVATTDFLLEGQHFRRDTSSARDVGHKAAARSLADVAAMGAVPSALLVALAAPGDLPVSWARDLAAGLAAECARVPGASVIGGDTARAPSVLLAVTGLGDLAGRAPVLRSGAAPGDVVAVAGPLGHAAAGLALLGAGVTDGPLVAAQLRPAPPYDAGPEAADLGATAMIDTSDGLLADLGHIAAASGVLIDLFSAALNPGDRLLAAARTVAAPRRNVYSGRTGRGSTPQPPITAPPAGAAPPASTALGWVLSGGEDHSLAATFPPGVRLPSRWTVIGAVRPAQGKPDQGKPDRDKPDRDKPGLGVLVDSQPWAHAPGWDHFA
jgi:thiamine-monophosphate kinase